MSKTAEEILLEKVLSEEQKEYGDHEFWKSQNRHELPQYLSAMHEFAAQEVAKEIEAYKGRLIAEIRADVKNSGPTMLIGDIALLIDTVK